MRPFWRSGYEKPRSKRSCAGNGAHEPEPARYIRKARIVAEGPSLLPGSNQRQIAVVGHFCRTIRFEIETIFAKALGKSMARVNCQPKKDVAALARILGSTIQGMKGLARIKSDRITPRTKLRRSYFQYSTDQKCPTSRASAAI